MRTTLTFNNKNYQTNLNQPIDISLAVTDVTRAWYINPPVFEPVRLGTDFIGSVAEGGSVNFRNVTFNPHAHGTHTECLGHVTKEVHSVNKIIKEHWFLAQLVTVPVQKFKDDEILTATALSEKWLPGEETALILRTSPNNPAKANQNVSNSNWPFLDAEAAKLICERGIKHLLIDQPSVDKEEDGGALLAHKAFWNIPENPRKEATITELIYIPDEVEDGLYLLNLQVAAMENDAAPSRPVIFKCKI